MVLASPFITAEGTSTEVRSFRTDAMQIKPLSQKQFLPPLKMPKDGVAVVIPDYQNPLFGKKI